ncbi:MAG: uncharacterized protein JWP97_4682 [Labilithrix sp.]|nr:uncharacterized protein [Labilithrix sp.]
MRSRLAFFLIASVAAGTILTAVACSSDPAEPATLPLIEGGTSTKKDASSGNELGDADVADTYIAPGSPSRIYAHTQDTLYLYEPITNELKTIGKFSCLDPTDSSDVVVDLAVDRTNTVYATTFSRFLKVDPLTAACTEIHAVGFDEDSYPNALSFVPAGTVDPTREALVGYAPLAAASDSTEYVRIDTATGATTRIGTLNASATGPQYRSSGDLVSLIQASNRTFLTVKLVPADGGAPTGTDLLAEVDPATGTLKTILGDTKQTDIFGLGYWGGKAYGFSDNGRISEIDPATGTATVVKTLTAGDGGAAPWYGAGVTTEAPVTK